MVAGEFPFDDIQATLDGEYVWPSPPSKQLQEVIKVGGKDKQGVQDRFV